MKTGIVDVGGGMRGIYAAGIFDWCLKQRVQFDLCIGVSAGSANVASYTAGQEGRNYRFYTEYSFRKKYMGIGRFLVKKSFADLDYVYGTLSNSDGEDPLDFQRMTENRTEVLVVATNARTGGVKYFDKNDMKQDHYEILKASSAIPFVCHPYEVDGIPYYDGALGDPVPVQKAFDCGCEKVVVVLTRPEQMSRTSTQDEKLAKRIQRKYPNAANALRMRAARYNEGVRLAQKYAEEGRVLIVSPDHTCGVDTLTRDKIALMALYQKGCHDVEKIAAFIES